MRLTIKELLEEGEMIIPMGRGTKEKPSGKERETLERFDDVVIEIAHLALPIEVYLMAGNPKTLALHPNKEGKIVQAVAEKLLKKDDGYELIIFAEPMET